MAKIVERLFICHLSSVTITAVNEIVGLYCLAAMGTGPAHLWLLPCLRLDRTRHWARTVCGDGGRMRSARIIAHARKHLMTQIICS